MWFVAYRLITAASEGRLQDVQLLLEQEGVTVDANDQDQYGWITAFIQHIHRGRTALQAASEKGQTDVVK